MAPDAVRASVLDDLTREFFERQYAVFAASFLQLDRYFRFPFGVARLPGPLRWRDRLLGLENLLSYAAVIATADIAGLLPWPIPGNAIRITRSLLDSPAVRTFCESRHYVLPLVLVNRLRGSDSSLQRYDLDVANVRLFQWYLGLRTSFRDDRAIKAFTDAALAGHDSVLGSDTSEELTQTDLGFFRLCAYLEEYSRLSEACERDFMLRAAMWHSHLEWSLGHARILDALLSRIERERSRSGDDDAVRTRWVTLAESASRVLRHGPMPQQWSAVMPPPASPAFSALPSLKA